MVLQEAGTRVARPGYRMSRGGTTTTRRRRRRPLPGEFESTETTMNATARTHAALLARSSRGTAKSSSPVGSVDVDAEVRTRAGRRGLGVPTEKNFSKIPKGRSHHDVCRVRTIRTIRTIRIVITHRNEGADERTRTQERNPRPDRTLGTRRIPTPATST